MQQRISAVDVENVYARKVIFNIDDFLEPWQNQQQV